MTGVRPIYLMAAAVLVMLVGCAMAMRGSTVDEIDWGMRIVNAGLAGLAFLLGHVLGMVHGEQNERRRHDDREGGSAGAGRVT